MIDKERVEPLIECVESVIGDLNPLERVFVLKELAKYVEKRIETERGAALAGLKAVVEPKAKVKVGLVVARWYPVTYVRPDMSKIKVLRPKLYEALKKVFPQEVSYDRLDIEPIPEEKVCQKEVKRDESLCDLRAT